MIHCMSRFFVPTSGTESWRALLAKPDLHWKEGRSAWLLAHAWEEAGGFPPEVKAVLTSSDDSVIDGLEFVVGFPEYETPLPGGSRPSQTDLLVLARNSSRQLVVIGVEGKVDEPFGPTVDEWLEGATPGKLERLGFLCEKLGLDASMVSELRYQLLHRTVAAMLEAKRFGAAAAVMMVHSFDAKGAGFDDFSAFGQVLGVTAARDSVVSIAAPANLGLAWVGGI
jgi:hypothetical protein